MSLFDIEENGLSNDVVSDLITQKLEEKYNQIFILKRIGNRYGTGKFDEVTAYCCPLNNKKMIFSVTFDMVKEMIIEDDFFLRNTCVELEEGLYNEFKKKNIESINKVEIIGKNRLDEILSVQEFSKKYTRSNFLATIIIRDEIAEKDLNYVFINIKNKFNSIYLKTLIYVMKDDDFDNCLEMSETLPALTTAFVEQYPVKNMHIIKVYKEEVIKIK